MKNILTVLLIVGTFAAQAASTVPPTSVSSVSLTSKSVNADMDAKLKKPITAEFAGAKLRDVATFLEQTAGVNIIVVQEPEATVTLRVKEMRLVEIIRYLAELTGMEAAVEENAVVFRPKTTTAVAGTGAGNYKMETSVESAKDPHQYTVAIRIHQSPDGKKWDVLSAPRITTLAGQEGKIEVKDEKTGDGVECTVLVTEVAAGTVEMSVVCKVKETGKPQWQSELKTRIKLP